MMDWKILLGIAGAVITIYSYVPYIRSVLRNETKPHIFSWLTWGLSAGVAFAAQIYNHAGPGAVVTALACVLALTVAGLAVRKGEKIITILDWAFFSLALTAIPIWLITDEPLWAAIIVTMVDVLGFGPTVRKSWVNPYEENASIFFLTGIQYCLSVLAIAYYDLTNLLYPIALITVSFGFALFLFYRRAILSKDVKHAA